MTFVTIPSDILVAVAISLKSTGYVVGKGLRAAIVARATELYPRKSGNWAFPNRVMLKGTFYPAYEASEGPLVVGKKTRKARETAKAGTATMTPAQARMAYARSCKGKVAKTIGNAGASPVFTQAEKQQLFALLTKLAS